MQSSGSLERREPAFGDLIAGAKDQAKDAAKDKIQAALPTEAQDKWAQYGTKVLNYGRTGQTQAPAPPQVPVQTAVAAVGAVTEPVVAAPNGASPPAAGAIPAVAPNGATYPASGGNPAVAAPYNAGSGANPAAAPNGVTYPASGPGVPPAAPYVGSSAFGANPPAIPNSAGSPANPPLAAPNGPNYYQASGANPPPTPPNGANYYPASGVVQRRQIADPADTTANSDQTTGMASEDGLTTGTDGDLNALGGTGSQAGPPDHDETYFSDNGEGPDDNASSALSESQGPFGD